MPKFITTTTSRIALRVANTKIDVGVLRSQIIICCRSQSVAFKTPTVVGYDTSIGSRADTVQQFAVAHVDALLHIDGDSIVLGQAVSSVASVDGSANCMFVTTTMVTAFDDER